MILMVGYQKVRPGKHAALDGLNKRWDAFEERLGLPPEKHYRCLIGGHEMGTMLLIREWESMAAMEAGLAKMMGEPELAELMAEANDLVESSQWELYEPA